MLVTKKFAIGLHLYSNFLYANFLEHQHRRKRIPWLNEFEVPLLICIHPFCEKTIEYDNINISIETTIAFMMTPLI